MGSGEFVSEDLGEEDIVGDVLRFELVATDGAVEVAGLPGQVQRAGGRGNVGWDCSLTRGLPTFSRSPRKGRG